MATTWSSANGSGIKQGKLGIDFVIVDYSAEIEVTAIVYLRTRYSCSDSSNNFYYDWDKSPGTKYGSKSISTTSNSSWSSSNIKKLFSKTKTFTKGTSAATKYFSVKYTGIEYAGGSGEYYRSFTVPALEKYTITYNANGGSGAPAAQSYYYSINTNLSSVKPTRDGYKFLGWSLSNTATSASYTPGQAWSGYNASNYTLYAVWEKQIYTITYNANGGNGAPTAQTKNRGVNITLSSEVPVLKGYKFVGWGTSTTDTTVDYNPGDTYSKDASITLYAIWKENKDLMALNEKGAWRKGRASLGGRHGTPWHKKNGKWNKGGA